MKRKPTFSPSIGPVSGPEDPIGDLAYELRSLLQTCRVDRSVRKDHLFLLRAVDALYTPTGDVENGTNVIAALCGALEHYAPPYTFFGPRQNDRGETEYGFWPELDNDLPRLDDSNDAMKWAGCDVMLVSDHGNVDCGRFDKRGRWHEYWSCV